MKLSIVIVNWNVKDLLVACLQSIFASQFAGQLEVLVVDNASQDGSVAMLQQNFPQVGLIASPQNLGFARGNNVGVAQTSGDYLFLLNPDTEIAPTALQILLDYLQTHPQVGVVGPQLRWPEGDVQSSRRQFPSVGSVFWESTKLEQIFPQNRIAQHYKLAHQADDYPQEVDWLVGAALLFRRDLWDEVGPLDESLFMYFEETDWCWRVVQAGWQIHYVPQAQVVHYEGRSSQQVLAQRTLRFNRSKLRYTRKWLGQSWARALCIFLWLSFLLEWCIEASKWLIGHKRPLRRERLGIYRQVLQGIWQENSHSP